MGIALNGVDLRIEAKDACGNEVRQGVERGNMPEST
jgi:hypothetical protein